MWNSESKAMGCSASQSPTLVISFQSNSADVVAADDQSLDLVAQAARNVQIEKQLEAEREAKKPIKLVLLGM